MKNLSKTCTLAFCALLLTQVSFAQPHGQAILIKSTDSDSSQVIRIMAQGDRKIFELCDADLGPESCDVIGRQAGYTQEQIESGTSRLESIQNRREWVDIGIITATALMSAAALFRFNMLNAHGTEHPELAPLSVNIATKISKFIFNAGRMGGSSGVAAFALTYMGVSAGMGLATGAALGGVIVVAKNEITGSYEPTATALVQAMNSQGATVVLIDEDISDAARNIADVLQQL